MSGVKVRRRRRRRRRRDKKREISGSWWRKGRREKRRRKTTSGWTRRSWFEATEGGGTRGLGTRKAPAALPRWPPQAFDAGAPGQRRLRSAGFSTGVHGHTRTSGFVPLAPSPSSRRCAQGTTPATTDTRLLQGSRTTQQQKVR